MRGEVGKFEVGTVSVVTTSDGGLSPEYWAERATKRIISVGGNSHPMIADQARAFQENIQRVIKLHIEDAIRSDRTTLVAELERQGHGDMAAIIRKLTR